MKRGTLFLVFFSLLLAGCSGSSLPEEISTLTIAPPLNPYQSLTSTPIPPTPTLPLPTSEPLIPSPTPRKHTVQAGETLSSIALQYNLTVDDLALANPGINTTILSIGMELTIPQSQENGLTAPTPTPYPLAQEEPSCYPTEDGGMWCYVMVKNDQDITLESISAAFNLYADGGQLERSVIAIPPLNSLFPGQSIPVGALIKDLDEIPSRVTATLLTALPSDLETNPAEISDYTITYSQENLIAEVGGTFTITDPDHTGDEAWIAGVGLSSGAVVGVRKWVSSGELDPGTTYPFQLQIYSLGPAIDQVQLLIEIH